MKLQRYDLIGQNEREIGEYEHGNYVLYTDHLEAVEQARADALRWVLGIIDESKVKISDYPYVDGFEDLAVSAVNIGVKAAATKLRSIIEKELSK